MRTDITLLDYTTTRAVQVMANDHSVIAAARVSTEGVKSKSHWTPTDESSGLINFLMRNRHGTPFEHNFFTFYVHAPIFVFREFHRHRIGWSYNEESGRYKVLDPVFYLPPPDRNLVQIGKTGAYEFVPGSPLQFSTMEQGHREVCEVAYRNYLDLLDIGIAKEVARMTLPVNIFSSMYASCNARSLMAFLSLRQQHNDATFPSKPMREINDVADDMEAVFAEHMPITHAAFVKNGRVAP